MKRVYHFDCGGKRSLRLWCRCWCHKAAVTERTYIDTWEVDKAWNGKSLGTVRMVPYYMYPMASQRYEAVTMGGKVVARYAHLWPCVRALLRNARHPMPALPAVVDSRTEAQRERYDADLNRAIEAGRQRAIGGSL